MLDSKLPPFRPRSGGSGPGPGAGGAASASTAGAIAGMVRGSIRGPLREAPRGPHVEPLVGLLIVLPKGPLMVLRSPAEGPGGGIMVRAPVSAVAEGDVNVSDAGKVLISKGRLSEPSGSAPRWLPAAFETMPGPSPVGKDLALGGKAFGGSAVDFPHDSDGIERLRRPRAARPRLSS